MSFAYAAGVGYFARTRASSSAAERGDCGRNPGYQTSMGTSLRPRRFSMSAATFGTSGDERTSSSIFFTRASGI